LDHERRFAASAAHELRTPIAEIRAIADVARRIGSTDALSTAASDISQVAGQMESVLAALLRLSKRRMELHAESFTEIHIAAAVEQALRRHRAGLASRGVVLRVHVPDELRCKTDSASLATILGNLADNAAEYTPDEGAITITARVGHGRLELEFANGPVALTVDEVARMFDPFWRKNSARASGDHAGLGLAIVRAMCESLDGQVRAELTDGRLRILVTLPVVAES
jgi:two-component system sensor histidine kinase QseC